MKKSNMAVEEKRLRKKIEWLIKVNNMYGAKLLEEKYERKYGKM